MGSEELRCRWVLLCASLGVSESVRDVWWNTIAAAYGEEWRQYHCLSHIEELVDYCDKYTLENANFVLLAIFFHDIVYVPKAPAGKNEDDSADVFRKFAHEAGLDLCLTKEISKAIVQTKKHRSTPEDSVDCQLFLDFDMAVLARPWDQYLRYTQQVRQEYCHVPQPMWCLARSEFLTLSLEHPVFSQLTNLEATATANIRREAQLLSTEFSNFNVLVRWFTRSRFFFHKVVRQ